MTRETERPVLDHWLWEKPMLRVFVIIAILVPVLISIILYFTLGAETAWFPLVFLFFAPLFGLGYGFVAKKISALRESTDCSDDGIIPGRTVIGVIEAPGLVVLGENSLILQPIAGAQSVTDLKNILSVKETSVLNGSALWGKRGFWFTIPSGTRLACAVPNSSADRFRKWLEDGMRDVTA